MAIIFQQQNMTLDDAGGLKVIDFSFNGTTTPGLQVKVLTTTQRNALSSPVNGVLIYNSTDNVFQFRQNGAWVDLPAAGGGGFTAVVQQVFTSSGTYTPTSGMAYCVVEAVGAGGGGGGVRAVAVGGNLNAAASGSGGGGEYVRSVFTAATIGASQAVTIGAGGTAGNATPTSGGVGGDTTLGVLLVAKGGLGGVAVNATTFAGTRLGAGGVGGTGGTGDFKVNGDAGGLAHAVVVANGTFGISPQYGSSKFSPSTNGVSNTAANSAVPGVAGSNYGQGGGGGVAIANPTGAGGTTQADTGGAGAPGLLIVTEFIQ